MERRDEKLDRYIGKRVKIEFFDGDVLSGNLEFHYGFYFLKNCMDEKKGWTRDDVHFRKSHVKKIEVK